MTKKGGQIIVTGGGSLRPLAPSQYAPEGGKESFVVTEGGGRPNAIQRMQATGEKTKKSK